MHDEHDRDTPSVDLVPATGSAVEWIHTLLSSADLPTADLEGVPTPGDEGRALYVVRADGDRVGCIGIERYGDAGLLRSAAIQARHRGNGYGRAAVRALEAAARDVGVEVLYLLTTTAAPFFADLGYAEIDREAVPEQVRSSTEFTDICPETAVPMCREL